MWVHAESFLHSGASPFHSFVTTLEITIGQILVTITSFSFYIFKKNPEDVCKGSQNSTCATGHATQNRCWLPRLLCNDMPATVVRGAEPC